MMFYRRGKDCGKSFLTTTNRNKHEKSKGHWSEESVSLSLIAIYFCLFVHLGVAIPLQSINATLRSI